ncbi:MAG: hypothetical protein QOI38_2726 [Sphingomonadales bacterium]|jgi:hypothetical protein|nr:hypothetical protein [Sphingomonadales bacterium]
MASRAPASAPAPQSESVVAPTPSRHRENARVRTALKVSSPTDAAEREAEATARRVMRMPVPARIGPILARAPLQAARAPAVSVPRPQAPPGAAAPPPRARPPGETSPELESAIKKEKGGGRSLPADVAGFMAPRFKADFSGVRIHTGGRAENLATRLGAKAFTFGRDIFFNAGQFKPDSPEGMELIAHELTHTIQQREVVQREVQSEAAPVAVRETSQPQVQRGIVGEALDWIADKANMIPGYRLLTIVIGRNPINMSTVSRSGANILRALIEFIPGGGLIVQALENHGVFEKGGKFIEEQFAALGDLGGAMRDALMEFIDSLGWRDIFRLGSLWSRAQRIFTVPVEKAISFGKNLVSGIAEIVKDAILKPLGRWAAANIPKWDLLVGVFGKNPISDEGASPASALIGGFMELIGQKEIWENIKKGNAVAKAWGWFQGAMSGALALVTSIPGRVMGVIRSLTIFDIVTIAGAFRKVFGAFASFVGDFIRWAGGTVVSLLEIILSVVAPSVLPYLKKAGGAFTTIIRNPVGFVRTLVRAGILGFRQFGRNFLTHLQASLVGWLTGALGGTGVYIPQGLNLREIIKFVLSVLGLTWVNIRSKLVRVTGEPTVRALETGFDLVRTLVTQGPAAAWEKIAETLGNLKQMAIDAIMEFVRSRVVQAAVTRLCSMITPAGAFIQAIIAIYNTVMFFVERIRQIAQVAASFIDSIATIASGNVAPAANRVEQTMAGLLTLVISFLARIAGLGRVSDAVTGLIARIRAPIDRALDRVVEWIVAQARRLGRFVAQAGVPHDPAQRVQLGARAGLAIANRFAGRRVGDAVLRPMLGAARVRFGLTSLEPVPHGRKWRIVARINPEEWLDSNADLEAQPPGAHEAAVQQLLGLQNRGGRQIVISPTATYGGDLVARLSQLHPRLLHHNPEVRANAVREARMKDKIWQVLQGMIYAPFVEGQQAAVGALRAAAAGEPFLYSLERGGSRLAEQIARGTGAAVVSMPKVNVTRRRPSGREEVVESKTAHVASLRARIVADLADDPTVTRTVTITETMVGGGSTDDLIHMVNGLATSGDYPNVTWRILLLQQTTQTANARGILEIREKMIAVPDKTKLIAASTPYILGEDVGYQSNRALATSKSPIILYKPTENTMYAYQIVPLGATTSADVISDLVSGKYSGRLPHVL